MSIPGSALPLLLASPAGAAAGYEIERSLRFNSADLAHLSRTPASAGNQKTFTWSSWIKRGKEADIILLCNADGGANNGFYLAIYSNQLFAETYTTSTQWNVKTDRLFRDFSAWYHIVVAVDTTQSTASDRVKIYVNGVQETSFSTSNYPSQNYDTLLNNTTFHAIGRAGQNSSNNFDGYLADVHFIDGQALDPSSFGEFDANNVWQPIAYSGTYGTNGFHLDFADNSSAAALGTDTSGNGNDWTVNNISVTAGADNDSLRDSPTNGNTADDTGLGGELAGNYCTANPVHPTGGTCVFSEGNLQVSTPTDNNGLHYCTIGVTSGKWYWESVVTSGLYAVFGIAKAGHSLASGGAGILGGSPEGWGYYISGRKVTNGVYTLYGDSWTTGDVIGIAFDATAGTLTFYKNGSSQGTAFTGLTSGPYFPAASDGNTSSSQIIVHNFGQRAFAYTAPSGFKALCTTNLPEPTIADGSTAMDALIWTGDGSSTRSLTGLEFNPDLVWLKSRSVNNDHNLFDSVRGVEKTLSSNLTAAEVNQPIHGYVTSFNSDGFSVAGGSLGDVNYASRTYVAWTWDAGSSTVSNTDGSITSSVRANPTAGFSIVTYTGNNAASGTIGHGLGVKPELIIVKRRGTGGNDWPVYHVALGATKAIDLNNTGNAVTTNGNWNDTEPTSSIFTVGTFDQVNAADTYVAYCFAPVEGYSAFGSYVGNGSADGPFVYTGHRCRWLMIKRSDGVDSWLLHDTARDTYNGLERSLYANASLAESSGTANLDTTSNGFKLRTTWSAMNASGATYIYAAFAENPFAYARAR